MRIALGIEYDGYAFSGWQTQPHHNTVQDTLEQALAKVAGTRICTVAAGRTDAGVHALMQVVHFDVNVERPLTAWVRGTNAFLPRSLAVLWACEVDACFHARFSACSRSYSYFLLTAPVRPALLAGKVGWFHRALDIDAMREAASCLVGRHDFSSFRAAGCQARSPVKHLQRLAIERHEGWWRFDFMADAFLHHMVRNLMGALVYVGKGALTPYDLATLLAQTNRSAAPPTFMPDGLYLTGIAYPSDFTLPTQIQTARITLWS